MKEKIEDWLIKGLVIPSSLKKIKEQLKPTLERLQKADLKKLSTRGDSIQYVLKDHINNDLLKILKKIVLNQYSKLFETDDVKLNLTNAWTVLAEKTGWHKLHQHNALYNEDSISVVIYLETPKKTSIDYPGYFYYVYKKGNDYIRYKTIDPEEGRIILMPTWLWHGAYPSSGKRQTLNLEFEY
tara:strand:+ start:192 stop:743 length:552 start_codon:yes stop_codon:yes gene_type:complete